MMLTFAGYFILGLVLAWPLVKLWQWLWRVGRRYQTLRYVAPYTPLERRASEPSGTPGQR